MAKMQARIEKLEARIEKLEADLDGGSMSKGKERKGKEYYTDVPAARVRMFRSLQLRERADEGECGANQVIMLATACT